MKRHLSARFLLVAGLLVVCLTTTVLAVVLGADRDASADPAGYATPVTSQPPDRPVAVFLGDSFTEATQVPQAASYVALVGARMGWRSINQGQGGTGYVTDGPAEFPERSPFPDRAAALIAMKPDIVVIAGGINDADKGYSNARVSTAVSKTLSQIKTGLPDAKIIVVGPFWPNGFPTKSALTIDQIVGNQARALDLPFVDPQKEHWVTGSADGAVPGNFSTMTGPDQTHPTVAGQLNIARRLTGDFERLGIE